MPAGHSVVHNVEWFNVYCFAEAADAEKSNLDTTGTMSLGDEPHNWYFEPRDMVGERDAVREIFKVPEGADVVVAADKIVVQLDEIVGLFGGFAGSLIWQNAK